MSELAAIALAAAYEQALCRDSLSDQSEMLLHTHRKLKGRGVELNDEVLAYMLRQMRIGGAGVSVIGPGRSVLVHSQCSSIELGRYQAYERQRHAASLAAAAEDEAAAAGKRRRRHARKASSPFRFSPFTAFRAESFFALRASALACNGRLDGDQSDVARVYVPLNGDGHWSLLVIDCVQQELRHYDSIRIGGSAFHVHYAQRVLDMLLAAGLLIAPWPIVDQQAMAEQVDGFSCGFAVLGAAAHESDYALVYADRDPLQVVRDARWMHDICEFTLRKSTAGRRVQDYEASRLRHYVVVSDGLRADAEAMGTKPVPSLIV